ncbi:hypothetical protein EST38_g9938 [Candolleomyces aberdarensis]|uniref:Citrate transporter-like domain-containing protein n=1 Tax=Candolleomyces aberdarensis TaxID=2316362 RepID=A0A4Q2D9D4_9AGAR|nr:hypothetical protein EST38_g9938 [Candolleomyces aberdarensis]
MITRLAIVTLLLFLISTIFVIQSLSFHVCLPFLGKRKVTIGLMTAPMIIIAILWASQCLGATQIRKGIVGTDNLKPYNIPIVFISLAYMAVTLDATGIFQTAAIWVSNKGGSSGRKLYLYLHVLFTLISMVVGNDSLILFVTIFLARHTAATSLYPHAWLISEFAAANAASMVLLVGNPTNLIICDNLRISHAAFTAYTVLPFVACSIACYLALMLQYRNEKHVPRKLNVSGHLTPRDGLRDPVSAIVGSIWLATCLIVVMALTFFHIDIWKIVLPFAGGKLIFDVSWDHYRYSKGKIPKLNENKPDDVNSTDNPGPMAIELRRATSEGTQRSPTSKSFTDSPQQHEDISGNEPQQPESTVHPFLNSNLQRAPLPTPPPSATNHRASLTSQHRLSFKYKRLAAQFPTVFTALPRLPFVLVPFAFSQFILIEALEHQGWIEIFARWLIAASNKQVIPVVWLVGVSGVVLCNIAGTNIGATILLTKIIRASDFPEGTARAAAVSLAVASNIGAVNFTFAASLGGLRWVAMLKDEGIKIKWWKFAMWNMLPLVAMMGAGFGVDIGKEKEGRIKNVFMG